MESVLPPMRCGREYLNNRLYNLQKKQKAGYYFDALLFVLSFYFGKKIRAYPQRTHPYFLHLQPIIRLLGRTKYKYVSTH